MPIIPAPGDSFTSTRRRRLSGSFGQSTYSGGWAAAGLATAAHVTFSPAGWAWDSSPAYGAALAYLMVVGSVIGFWGFLTTVARLGPERASYIPVLFPVVALAISTLAEDYAWQPEAITGLGLVLAGNFLVLVKPAAAAAQKSSSSNARVDSAPRITAPASPAVSPSRFSA